MARNMRRVTLPRCRRTADRMPRAPAGYDPAMSGPGPVPPARPTRRDLLRAGAATLGLAAAPVGLSALAGCTAAPGGPPPRGIPSGSPTSSVDSTSAGPTGPGPSPSEPDVPSRAQIVARFAGVVPTQWGVEVTGVVRHLDLQRSTASGSRGSTGGGTATGAGGRPTAALTFDACGGPSPTSSGCGADQALLALLRRYAVPATLFLNARWIAANPGLTDELVHDPLFEIGNHGTRHQPLSVNGRTAYTEQGTADVGAVFDEIAGNRERLTQLLGRPPAWFRSGTAHYDEVAVQIVGALGERVAGFSVNGDAGTTFSAAQVAVAVGACRDGDIVISHFNRPEHQTAAGYAAVLPRLVDRGYRFVTLSRA